MSKVHDAMRGLEQKNVAEPASVATLSSLVGALLGACPSKTASSQA